MSGTTVAIEDGCHVPIFKELVDLQEREAHRQRSLLVCRAVVAGAPGVQNGGGLSLQKGAARAGLETAQAWCICPELRMPGREGGGIMRESHMGNHISC